MRWFIAATVVSLALVPLRGVRSRADEPGTADGKEPVVVATWEHQVAGKSATIKLYSNGRINDPAGKNTWAQKGNTLTLRWPNPKAPGGRVGRHLQDIRRRQDLRGPQPERHG